MSYIIALCTRLFWEWGAQGTETVASAQGGINSDQSDMSTATASIPKKEKGKITSMCFSRNKYHNLVLVKTGVKVNMA